MSWHTSYKFYARVGNYFIIEENNTCPIHVYICELSAITFCRIWQRSKGPMPPTDYIQNRMFVKKMFIWQLICKNAAILDNKNDSNSYSQIMFYYGMYNGQDVLLRLEFSLCNSVLGFYVDVYLGSACFACLMHQFLII